MSTDQSEGEKDQKSITLEMETIEQLREAHPHALDDSERIRRAIADSIDLQTAKSFQITRRDE
ncbi:hypothetical protein G9464_20640 [Halostella sp. JP-L12]|uniref:hypothetical protein n=1 Tax=Halostella TaxID=1843185 RepID=UPI000EF7B72A|nr:MULTISPECIES: hypothetical protein [Halostella]NHN49980.1 hypothetical protein [Halostella sp. JP-L12]